MPVRRRTDVRTVARVTQAKLCSHSGYPLCMSPQRQKVVQYLNEAHASEVALVRVLQSQIAMTPRGAYRNALETHLRETRDHAGRVDRRLAALGQGGNPLMAVVGAVESAVGQALAFGKTPIDLLRGS